MRVFWWAEFQKRGAIHYHGIVVDAPFANLADARRWFTAHWRSSDGGELAQIQAWVDFMSADWFRRAGGDYILKDVRKLNGKRYEQDYTLMPAGWRTFSSNQLAFAAAEHQEHEDKHEVQYLPAVATKDSLAPAEVLVIARHQHVPAEGGCRLFQRRQRRRSNRKFLSSQRKL